MASDIWLNSNGIGNSRGFYRWELFVAATYGCKAMMQWSISPCGDVRNCGPKARWAPFPCLLDMHGNPFNPVFNMAQAEHAKIAVLGPILLGMESKTVVRTVPSRNPTAFPAGTPLRSIGPGGWVVGLFVPKPGFVRDGGSDDGVPDGYGDCIMITNDNPTRSFFAAVDLVAGGMEVPPHAPASFPLIRITRICLLPPRCQ